MDTLFPNSEVLAVQVSADIMNGEEERVLAISKPTSVYVDNLLTKSGIGHCGELSLPAFLVQDGAGQVVCDSLSKHDVGIVEKAPSEIQPCQPHVHKTPRVLSSTFYSVLQQWRIMQRKRAGIPFQTAIKYTQRHGRSVKQSISAASLSD